MCVVDILVFSLAGNIDLVAPEINTPEIKKRVKEQTKIKTEPTNPTDWPTFTTEIEIFRRLQERGCESVSYSSEPEYSSRCTSKGSKDSMTYIFPYRSDLIRRRCSAENRPIDHHLI